jgi:hypothetical protein
LGDEVKLVHPLPRRAATALPKYGGLVRVNTFGLSHETLDAMPQLTIPKELVHGDGTSIPRIVVVQNHQPAIRDLIVQIVQTAPYT